MGIDYVTILCGSFNDGHKPLSRAEFWSLYHKYGDSVRGIFARLSYICAEIPAWPAAGLPAMWDPGPLKREI